MCPFCGRRIKNVIRKLSVLEERVRCRVMELHGYLKKVIRNKEKFEFFMPRCIYVYILVNIFSSVFKAECPAQ